MSSERAESLEAFKNSFSYGPRNDLNFKFLKNLSAEEAARFFRELLWKLGDTYDDGDVTRLIEHAYQWQVRGYQGAGHWSQSKIVYREIDEEDWAESWKTFFWPEKIGARENLLLMRLSSKYKVRNLSHH